MAVYSPVVYDVAFRIMVLAELKWNSIARLLT
jgi:hypothetical protein